MNVLFPSQKNSETGVFQFNVKDTCNPLQYYWSFVSGFLHNI